MLRPGIRELLKKKRVTPATVSNMTPEPPAQDGTVLLASALSGAADNMELDDIATSIEAAAPQKIAQIPGSGDGGLSEDAKQAILLKKRNRVFKQSEPV
jgi:hypothetical protein